MYDKKTLLDFAFWWHNWLDNAERREVDIDFDKFLRMYYK